MEYLEKYYFSYGLALSECNVKGGHIPSFVGILPAFFICKNLRCRGPPSIVFIFKKFKTIGGKKMASMPKRRKSKDNPYLLKYDEKNNTFMVVFKNIKKEVSKVSITEKIYNAFNEFELNDLSQLNEFDRHIEHSELMDETLYKRAANYQESVEDIVENNILLEELRYALNSLPDVQKRRIKMYYFDNLTLEQIAVIEHTTHQAISKSISIGIEKIRKNLKF